jgi:hypothetical protein
MAPSYKGMGACCQGGGCGNHHGIKSRFLQERPMAAKAMVPVEAIPDIDCLRSRHLAPQG